MTQGGAKAAEPAPPAGLPYGVRDAGGRVRGFVAQIEDAACLVVWLGVGSRIVVSGEDVWHEGREEQAAAASVDFVADVVGERVGRIVARLVQGEMPQKAEKAA